MSDTLNRYDAIRRMLSCGVTTGETESQLLEMLSHAQAAVPHLSLRIDASPSDAVTSWDIAGPSSSFGRLVCDEPVGEEDQSFLRSTADAIGIFLTSRSASPQSVHSPVVVGKRIEEVSAIYEISQAFSSASIDGLLNLITVKAAEVMDAQACSLMLKDPQKDELVIRASYGLSNEIVEETRVPYGEGIAGRVAQTGEPMLLSNLMEDPRFAHSDVIPRPDITSSICVPLRDAEGRVHGVLSIRRRSPAAMFSQDDVKLFCVFASQAALAFSNARLYSSLKDRVQELSTLYEASRELGGAYSLESASDALINIASQMVDGVSAVLLLLDRHQGRIVRTVSGGFRGLKQQIADAMNDGVVMWMHSLREPRSLALETPSRRPTGVDGFVEALRARFPRVSLIPLIAEDSVIGMLVLGNENGKWLEQRRIRLLSIVASQAAVIIKNASRYEEQIGQKVLELSALYELSERISTARNLNEALDSILDIVRDIVWYDESFVSTVDYERRIMVVQASRGAPSRQLQGMEMSLNSDSLGSWAIRERKALVSSDISKDERFGSLSLDVRSDMVRSLMAIPLIVHDEVVGVLNVCGYAPNLYTEDHVRTLSVIASQAAALYKELEALGALASYTDNILRSIAVGVVTFDRDGTVLTWNAAAEDIIGLTADEVVGRHYTHMLNAMGVEESDKRRLLEVAHSVLTTGQKYVGYKVEFSPIGGERMYRNISISELHNHMGEQLGFVAIFEDVTAQVQMEKEMQRITELAATGQLAASIAHELRNPLSSIKGAAQYLRNEYEDHTAVREFLDIIIDEVNVLNRITTEFLDFARPTRYEFAKTSINELLTRTFSFLRPESDRQKVEIVLDLDPNLPKVPADARQLEQAFRNMVLNALQALPEGGTITVSTSGNRDGIRIVIADNGIGIPEDKLEQVFIPFFTTKTKGTGLGLAMVQKVLVNHDGRVSVRSTVGQGTVFEITLPLSSDRSRSTFRQPEDDGAADFLRREQANF